MSNLTQAAYENIRRQIMAGELNSATPVSEPALARSLKISRTPIREAIHRLQSEGLLEQRPKSGTFVRVPTRAEMRDLYELRILLEPHATAKAARKRTPALLSELAELLTRMQDLGRRFLQEPDRDLQTGMRRQHSACDHAFHEAILRQAGNARLLSVVGTAGILSLTLRIHNDRSREMLHQVITRTTRDHARIFRAIEKGDASSARKAMRGHLLRSRQAMLDHYAWLEHENKRADSDVPV